MIFKLMVACLSDLGDTGFLHKFTSESQKKKNAAFDSMGKQVSFLNH